MHPFSEPRFWASKFGATVSRGFLLKTRYSKECRDWRSLYRRTNGAHGPPGLQYRKRIWNRVSHSRDYLVCVGMTLRNCLFRIRLSSHGIEGDCHETLGEHGVYPVCRLLEPHIHLFCTGLAAYSALAHTFPLLLRCSSRPIPSRLCLFEKIPRPLQSPQQASKAYYFRSSHRASEH